MAGALRAYSFPKSLPAACGVYGIFRAPGFRSYIGSSQNVRTRCLQHFSDLNRGAHHSIILQRAWKKHGASKFLWVFLGDAALTTQRQTEQKWLDVLRPPYNRATDASKAFVGQTHSADSRAKMSASRKGRIISPEWRAKIGAAQKGQKRSPSACANISAALRGKKKTPVHIRKMVATRMANGTYSPSIETRRRISATAMGKTRGPHSIELKRKMTAAKKIKRAERAGQLWLL